MCKERSAVLSLSAFRSLACACTRSHARPNLIATREDAAATASRVCLKFLQFYSISFCCYYFQQKIPNAAQVNLSTKMATSQPTTGPHCTQRRKVKKGEMSQRHDRKRIDSEQGRICTCGTLRQRDSISRRVASFVGTVLSFVTRWSFFNNFGCSIG